MKTFKKTQRFRVIVYGADRSTHPGVSFYTDAGQLRDGVGDFTTLNETCRAAMEALEDMIRATGPAVGLTFERNGYHIQLSMV